MRITTKVSAQPSVRVELTEGNACADLSILDWTDGNGESIDAVTALYPSEIRAVRKALKRALVKLEAAGIDF